MSFYSRVLYANGGALNYAVPFPYIAPEHVTVLDNNAPYVGTISWLNPTTITLTPDIASGHTVELRRVTPRLNPLVAFVPGTIKSDDLNLVATQNRYIGQEALDLIGVPAVIVPGGGGGGGGGGSADWITLANKPFRSLLEYGAVCDVDPILGTGTDDSAAWAAAIADVNAGTIAAIFVPRFSGVTGSLPAITNACAIIGMGHENAGIIHLGGGDVTMLSVDYTAATTNILAAPLRFATKGLYVGTVQGALGQAMKVHVYEASLVEMEHLVVSGSPSRFGTSKHGWKRGVELINVTSSRFHNVTVNGCVDPTGTLAYPAKVFVTDYAWSVHADTSHSTTNNYWTACNVLYVNKAWQCEGGNIQGLFWTDCTPAWVGTGWSIVMTDGTWGPCFGWKGGSPECIHAAIVANNIAYLDIAQMTFLMDEEIAEVRNAISLTNVFQANVHDNMLVNIGGIGGTGSHGTCNFLVATDCTKIQSHDNQLSGLDAYGIRFTGTTSYSDSYNDKVYFPTGAGIPFKNDASGGNLLTNQRRNMRIEGGTAAQGAPISGKDTTVRTVNSTQTPMLQLQMGVEPGDKVRVSFNSFVQIDGTGECMPVMVVREYNHRSGTASPYTILQRAVDIKNAVASGHLTTIKGQHYFMDDVVFDIIAGATDALFSFELYSDPTSGHTFTYNYAQMQVERL